MPELPEVETIGRALKSEITGCIIESVAVLTPKLREPLDSLRAPALIGKRVLDVRRRGRYLVVELDGACALLMHFGMSGVLKLLPENTPRAKHEHVIFGIGANRTLRFECPRRFSLLKFVPLPAPGAFPAELDKLGVEPLSEAWNEAYFLSHAKGRTLPVKEFLMDNALVTGIGNIYATEALFAARISPLRPAGKVKKAEAKRLIAEVKKVLLASIAAGGTTFSDYRQLDGSTGKYALNLSIYGRKGEPCPVCGKTLLAVTLGGRTSVYCPSCQKR